MIEPFESLKKQFRNCIFETLHIKFTVFSNYFTNLLFFVKSKTVIQNFFKYCGKYLFKRKKGRLCIQFLREYDRSLEKSH
jgi:hypothetical protein